MTRHFVIIYSTINESSNGIYLKIKIRNREFKDFNEEIKLNSRKQRLKLN